VPLGQVCLNSILFHHEKGDGSGYPAGLTMASIPLHARIVGIADVFDGLTSRRSFVDPISADRALSMILEPSTGLYDPNLLERFAEVLTQAGAAGLN
jgi:putative two-component system response regulator